MASADSSVLRVAGDRELILACPDCSATEPLGSLEPEQPPNYNLQVNQHCGTGCLSICVDSGKLQGVRKSVGQTSGGQGVCCLPLTSVSRDVLFNEAMKRAVVPEDGQSPEERTGNIMKVSCTLLHLV